MPPQSAAVDDDDAPDPITSGELARAVSFALGADNPACAADLQQIAIDVGIDWRSLINIGTEDSDNAED